MKLKVHSITEKHGEHINGVYVWYIVEIAGETSYTTMHFDKNSPELEQFRNLNINEGNEYVIVPEPYFKLLEEGMINLLEFARRGKVKIKQDSKGGGSIEQ